MNRLSTKDRAQIIGMMCEGMAIRAISRLTGASKNTIVKLLKDAGEACLAYQDNAFRNLPCKRVQVDEIWSFVGAKEANVDRDKKTQGWGDCWTWTAICADTKLVPAWLVGPRNSEAAHFFLRDLAARLKDRVQLTSDGWAGYTIAVSNTFGNDVDYAQLVKIYGKPEVPEVRYSPAKCIGAEKHDRIGSPDKAHISTSFVERQNLTMRMGMRRFTRLTNAFSKKVENHAHAISIYFMHYNFVKQHAAHRLSPAMAAGVSDKLWSLEDIVGVVEQWEGDKRGDIADGQER
jgi:IS1 family transposase